jgi:hypothetical protein
MEQREARIAALKEKIAELQESDTARHVDLFDSPSRLLHCGYPLPRKRKVSQGLYPFSCSPLQCATDERP